MAGSELRGLGQERVAVDWQRFMSATSPPSPSKALDPALLKEVFRAFDRWRSRPKYALGQKYNEVLKHNMREDLVKKQINLSNLWLANQITSKI